LGILDTCPIDSGDKGILLRAQPEGKIVREDDESGLEVEVAAVVVQQGRNHPRDILQQVGSPPLRFVFIAPLVNVEKLFLYAMIMQKYELLSNHHPITLEV
jgi:hypothetical protein